MINPKLKDALMEWLTSVKRQQIADTEHNDAGYIYHNGKRLAALEEIRKIVEKGEFDAVYTPSDRLFYRSD